MSVGEILLGGGPKSPLDPKILRRFPEVFSHPEVYVQYLLLEWHHSLVTKDTDSGIRFPGVNPGFASYHVCNFEQVT